MATVGLVSTSGWLISSASRSGGAIGIVTVPAPEAVTVSVDPDETKELLDAKDYAGIEKKVRDTLALVRSIRGK